MQTTYIDTWADVNQVVCGEYDNKSFSKDGKDGKDDATSAWLEPISCTLPW